MSALDKTRFVMDAVGEPIYRGDTVAHCRVSGSRLVIDDRKVLDIRDDGTLVLQPWTEGGQSGRTQPYNCVKVKR